jgi:hypothetical protein
MAPRSPRPRKWRERRKRAQHEGGEGVLGIWYLQKLCPPRCLVDGEGANDCDLDRGPTALPGGSKGPE